MEINGQKNTREEYISDFSDLAMREMVRVGIPASITLAQGCLESNNGNSTLAVRGNNHFGIKCHDWTGKKIYHDDDRRKECFRSYPSAYDSYMDHSEFLTTKSRYASLFELSPHDYRGWA
ncbi:MAG: glucosaminidase domain-containing protein, partial [Bacteroidota bacterium]|nr:glucosaminidase domain-containing protein [Bacteroidota bacterium]